MAENLLTAPITGTQPAAGAPPVRPAEVPEKFWDAAGGTLRIDALLKSYLELERRLSAGDAAAAPDRGAMLRALGVPEGPDGYRIACTHGLFEPDQEINGRLHAAGYTPEQAQLLYDLAAERMVPLIQDLAAEFQAEREVARLVERFGGEEKWREVSRQLLAWAGKTLPAAAVDGLSTTYEGVMALYKMMTGAEPATLRTEGGGPAGAAGEAELHAMMRDPRYWRDRDPSLVARVTEGFQRMFPGG